MSTPPPEPNATHPLLIVLSGPSGVGKDAVLSRMRELGKPYHFTVTATTRPKRPAERDGIDYIFVTTEAFLQMVQRGELLEWAEVYGYLYGVPKAQVVEAFRQGRDVIIKADVQGATTIKRLVPQATFIFLAPPNLEELACRLRQRLTESPEALRLRLETAALEMQQEPNFDYVVVNHQNRVEESAEDIDRIVAQERRSSPLEGSLFE